MGNSAWHIFSEYNKRGNAEIIQVAGKRPLSSNREMSLRLNPVRCLALAAACLYTTALVAQTDKAKCTWTGFNGKPVTDLCSYAPPGAKMLNPPPATPAPATATTPATKAFPFPGETPSDNTQNATAPQNPSVQTGAPMPASTDSAAPAAKRFPFPGENPDPATPMPPAAPEPSPNGLKDAGSQGESTKPAPGESSSSSSSSSSSENLPPGTNDPNDPPDAAPIPHHSRKPVPVVKEQSPDEREAEDVTVAAFYMNTNNFQGAYMRSKDAVSLDDSDPEAHLALAEAARRLGKLDEAQQHYKRCLELDPLPKDRKVAEQALKQMAGKG